MLAIPNQTPGVPQRYGLSRADVDRAVWSIDGHGRKLAGAAAANRALEALGGGWVVLARLYRLPPLGWLEDRVYDWVARHRSWLSRWWGATPELDRPVGEG